MEENKFQCWQMGVLLKGVYKRTRMEITSAVRPNHKNTTN